MSDELSVAFKASLKRVASVSSGGFTVAFDIPDVEAAAAAKLLSQFRDCPLSVAVVVDPEKF